MVEATKGGCGGGTLALDAMHGLGSHGAVCREEVFGVTRRTTQEHKEHARVGPPPPILVICFLTILQVAKYGCAPLAVICVLVHLPD